MLKEIHWRCECGSLLRYWNKLRQAEHLTSAKHEQWKLDGIVKETKKPQRCRKTDEMKVEKLSH